MAGLVVLLDVSPLKPGSVSMTSISTKVGGVMPMGRSLKKGPFIDEKLMKTLVGVMGFSILACAVLTFDEPVRGPVVLGAGRYRLRVVYGEFDSREAALEAERRLPPKYQQAFETSPRSFAELRGQI